MKRRITLSRLSIILTMFIVIVVSSNLNWGQDKWKRILGADAKGYYAYLPAIFIYGDLNFGFFDKIEKEKYYNKNLYYDYRIGSNANGKVIDKYYCGTAIAELPFFLIAHSFSAVLGFEADGYSKLYLVFINIAALFYLLVGLHYLNSTLSLYKISEKQKSLVLIAAVFGTNLFFYTVSEPGMSHIYSFAFISMFIYFSKKYFSSFQEKHIILLSVLLAIIILIRPVNGFVIFIWPFVAGSFISLKQGLLSALQNHKSLVLSFLCFLTIIFIQLIIYKISTGNFIVYAYGEEGFNFLSPHMFDILFSYKKGLFLYTPMFLISLAGFWFLWKTNKFEFYSLVGFLILITYVFSSWWMWYYGGSFSARVYVEYIPLFMIILAIALNRIRMKYLKVFYISSILLLVVFCQIQTYQYRYYEIHWSDMTKEKYWDVFLRIDRLIK